MLASLAGAIAGLGTAGAVIGATTGSSGISSADKSFSADIARLESWIQHRIYGKQIQSETKINYIETQIVNLINSLKNYVPITLNQPKIKIAKLFFPNETVNIQNIQNNLNKIYSDSWNQVRQLDKYWKNGKLLYANQAYGDLLSKYDGINENEAIKTILKVCQNLGIMKDNVRIGDRPISLPWYKIYFIPANTDIYNITQIVNLINEYNSTQQFINDILENFYKISTYIITTLAPSPTGTIPTPTIPSPTDTITGTPPIDLPSLLDKIRQGLITGSLASMILAMVRTATKTRTRAITKTRRKRKIAIRYKRKRNNNKPTPKIRYMYANVGQNSAWIQKISFIFYNPAELDSDNIGKLIFHLKSGGTITKSRVKRGTFSTIIMWSYKTYHSGAGYRYWSQFNKARIVNRYKVISWFIPRINQRDREIAIPLEIKENRVKYR